MKGKCEFPGCEKEGNNLYDHSLQLPDYHQYCDEHYDVVQKKESLQFLYNLLKMKVYDLKSEVVEKLISIEDHLSEIRKILDLH